MRMILGACLALAIPAMALAQGTGPAELPPAGFAGTSYIDSAGCIFDRVERNGAVTWAERMNAARQPLCGFAPTQGDGPVAAAPAPAPAPAQATAPMMAAAAAPMRMAGPHAPRRVNGIMVPPGYTAAWTDGRVNPNRGPRSAAGDAQSAQVWTETVPRRLVDPVADPGAALRGPGPAWVELGRYASLADAEAAAEGVSVRGAGVHIGQGTVTGSYRVLIGPYANLDAARAGYEIAYRAGFNPVRIRN